jgi:hypothetical protein
MSDTKAKNPPVAKIRVGGVTASIWENKGEKGTSYSVTFDRRYKDAAGEWHSSTSYNAGDLLELAKAADLAHTRVLDLLAAGE